MELNPIEGWFGQSAQRRVHFERNVRLGEAPRELAAMKVGIASNARKLVETLYCLLQSIGLDRELASEATDRRCHAQPNPESTAPAGKPLKEYDEAYC